ncbi:hypothetical protein PEBR_22189 [Penicillium brasilianum]|uniref:Uncharacterized protein n=1 Tax=Penicillium brasilianum TaxID=104259 RepID=A0A1S9RMJ8_PENBI|nr:hypothetical protein PEBR_22189 [Penicillium brasilianum]
MPDESGRRIIIEKSSTVRRRYQRSNKRFKFTASQLRRIEREEELERRAKALKEKEEKRRANKKKRAEKEAKDREERKRLGLPDPNAPKIPASQQLLSAFLGAKPKQLVEEQPVDTTVDSTATDNDEGGDTEVDSAGGDTEPESDIFDDLDEEIIEEEFSCLQDAGIPKDSEIPDVSDYPEDPGVGNDVSAESLCSLKDDDDDEFSDCSVFDDADIMNEAIAIAASRPSQPIPLPSTSHAPLAPTMGPPRSSGPSKSVTTSIPSLGDSFRDETADYLEDVFSRGYGDSFGELVQLGSGTR